VLWAGCGYVFSQGGSKRKKELTINDGVSRTKRSKKNIVKRIERATWNERKQIAIANEKKARPEAGRRALTKGSGENQLKGRENTEQHRKKGKI